MKKNIIQEKSFDFALRIVDLSRKLRFEEKEFILSNQLLKSGTSVGANVEEAIGGFSRKEFSSKLGIAYKESRETRYWLRLLYESKFIPKEDYIDLIKECNQIIKILSSILLTLKQDSKPS